MFRITYYHRIISSFYHVLYQWISDHQDFLIHSMCSTSNNMNKYHVCYNNTKLVVSQMLRSFDAVILISDLELTLWEYHVYHIMWQFESIHWSSISFKIKYKTSTLITLICRFNCSAVYNVNASTLIFRVWWHTLLFLEL